MGKTDTGEKLSGVHMPFVSDSTDPACVGVYVAYARPQLNRLCTCQSSATSEMPCARTHGQHTLGTPVLVPSFSDGHIPVCTCRRQRPPPPRKPRVHVPSVARGGCGHPAAWAASRNMHGGSGHPVQQGSGAVRRPLAWRSARGEAVRGHRGVSLRRQPQPCSPSPAALRPEARWETCSRLGAPHLPPPPRGHLPVGEQHHPRGDLPFKPAPRKR